MPEDDRLSFKVSSTSSRDPDMNWAVYDLAIDNGSLLEHFVKET
jgi:hypothetical protein